MPKNIVKNPTPLVSALVVTYNAGKYLKPAIASLLNQTLRNLEVIVVDNASSDGSVDALEECFNDHRLLVLHAESNLGPFGGAMFGLDHCSGKYIARMDADDLSFPGRFAQQVAFLEKHKHVSLVGGDALFIDEDGYPIGCFCAIRPSFVRIWSSNYEPAFLHSTCMFRSDSLKRRGYDTNLRAAGDFELIQHYTRVGQVAVVSRPVCIYRVLPGSISKRGDNLQLLCANMIRMRAFFSDKAGALISELDSGALERDSRRLMKRRELNLCFAKESIAKGNPEAATYFLLNSAVGRGILYALRRCYIPEVARLLFVKYVYGVFKRVLGRVFVYRFASCALEGRLGALVKCRLEGDAS
jgi:glycosyltransferase involved in cell wall biosynthesis